MPNSAVGIFKPCHDHANAVPKGCHCHSQIDELVLMITRLTCAGFHTESVAFWDLAYEHAEELLGEVDGPPFVARLSALVRALSKERVEDFHFMPAACSFISVDECDFLHAIRSSQQQYADLIHAAVALTKSRKCPKTILAAHAVGVSMRRTATCSAPMVKH